MWYTGEEFEQHLRNIKESPVVAVDTEGSVDHPFSKTVGLSTSATGVAEYFPVAHRFGYNLPPNQVQGMVETLNAHPCLVMHHAKHDIRSLRNIGVDVKNFYCTMMMAHFNDENVLNKSLDYLSKMHGGEPKAFTSFMNDTITAFGWDFIPSEAMREYGMTDAYITEKLFVSQWPSFQAQGFDGELWDVEQKWIKLIANMEDNGILIDESVCEEEYDKGIKVMHKIQQQLGFNPGSTKDLGKFFLEELKFPVLKRSKKTKKPSFDKTVMEKYDSLLQQINDPRAELILTYRGWQKTTSSNYKPYLELRGPDGRLRPNFKIHGTRTGRMSCELPNLQQIPRISEKPWNGRLKQAFIPTPGYTLWEADYSQLEFRLAAAYGKETKLIEIFNDPTRDIFSEMALDLNLTRDQTKTFNYSIQYGAGVDRVSTVFDISHMMAKAYIENYYTLYSGFRKVKRLAEARAIQNGYVKYWTGRRRHFQYPSEAHKAFNAVLQGGAFEIVKRRMIALDEAGILDENCRLNLQVHDSVCLEVANGKEHLYLPEVKKVLEDVDKEFGVIFRIEIHKWGTKEQYVSAAA